MIISFDSKHMRTTSAREGFTLIELLVALLIVGGLMAATFTTIRMLMGRAKRTQTETLLRQVQQAVNFYQQETESYPTTLQDLVRPPQGEAAKKWNEGGYLGGKKVVPKDGWGNPLQYRQTPDGEHSYELYSYGSGGKRGKQRISVWDL